MNLKRLNLLFVLFISAIIYTAIPVCAQENVVTNPVITELNDNFYIHSEYGKNVYIENGVKKYYQGKITFEGIDSEYCVFVKEGEHNITFSDVNIRSIASSPLDITDEAAVNLTLESSNILSADNFELAAIHIENGSKLTISGNGKLYASGGKNAACIGGNYNNSRSKSFGGDVTITGGEIFAKTGVYAIGHANFGNNYDMVLPSDPLDFEMTGGTLYAQKTKSFIKDRIDADNTTITGGCTDAFSLCNTLSLLETDDCKILSFEGISYRANGAKTIDGMVILPYSAGVPSKIVTSEGTFLRLDSSHAYIPEDMNILKISGENLKAKFMYTKLNEDDYLTTRCYSLDDGKTWQALGRNTTIAFCNYTGSVYFEEITLNIIFYNVSLEDEKPFVLNKANITLTLFGSNTSKADDDDNAGVNVPPESELTITRESAGNLEAQGDGDGAGIGGNLEQDYGTINIYGGGVRAISGTGGGAAGIGSGYDPDADGGNITIGGNASVYAKSYGAYYYGGAGIGGGNDSGAGTILICDNARVTAYGGPEGAGIGSSGDASSKTCNITIKDNATVYAEGDYGAGIGGGYQKDGGNITILSGTVEAKSINGGAGIGGGAKGGDSGNIVIKGGNVKTTVTGDGSNVGHGSKGSNTCTIPTLTVLEVDVKNPLATVAGNCLIYSPVDNFNWHGIRFFDADYNRLYLYLPSEADVPQYFMVDELVYKWNGSKYIECEQEPVKKKFTIENTVEDITIKNTGYFTNCDLVGKSSFDCPENITLKNANTTNNIDVSGIGFIELTLDNVTVKPSVSSDSAIRLSDGINLFINLVGKNELVADYGGITVNKNCVVRISGDGSLNVIALSESAIGGTMSKDTGSIVITSGNIYAESKYMGNAGIGGAFGNSSLGRIIINGGHITAIGGGGASGIGGGIMSTCEDKIIINSGTIQAYGGIYKSYVGSGIGFGGKAINQGPDVIINGGNVFAKSGGEEAPDISSEPVNNDGTKLTKLTLTFENIEDKTQITSQITNAKYDTQDINTIGDKLYLYLPEDADVTDVITVEGNDYHRMAISTEQNFKSHIYSTTDRTKILFVNNDKITVVVSDKEVASDKQALLLYGVYENNVLTKIIKLECPLNQSGKAVVELPEGLAPKAGDIIYLWDDAAKVRPMCQKYIIK